MTSSTNPDQPIMARWILDTRPWYPEARTTKELETHAARALSILPPASRAAILRYYHPRDAKMALASALLKHYTVGKLCPAGTPRPRWSATTITRDARSKPVYVDPATGRQPVSFNVSHQAGIVAIVAVANYHPPEKGGVEMEVEVGVDIVCTSERRDRDHGMVASDGWPAFVDMHGDVFAPGEVGYLKQGVLAVWGTTAGRRSVSAAEEVTDSKLRAFYALWALREAYVKLTGEALLAPWLKELEFRGFRAPTPTDAWEVPAREDGGGGEVIRSVDIWFKGKRVEDVNMCLRSMGPDYMIATAVRTPGNTEDALRWRLGPYEVLSLEEVLDFAESSG